MAPARIASFQQYVTRVQGYLRKESVPFVREVDNGAVVASVGTLGLRDTPAASELRWLRHGTAPKVPVEIVASGPRMIALGAVLAERLTLAVGAEPARISWAIEIARSARTEQGLDPNGLVLGAMVPVTCGTDRAAARSRMAGAVPGFVRFSVMHGDIVGPVSSEVGEALKLLHRSYDMNQHGRAGRQSELVTDALLDTFTIAGPPEECAVRLAAIGALGVDVFHLQGAFFDAEMRADQESWSQLAAEVLPQLRTPAATEESRG